ncbi:hypothetical protein Busp01_41000 [Trinickia caryophylli]|nr:hypothetical protein Busp01_41000 [Trinickia caryophylli]
MPKALTLAEVTAKSSVRYGLTGHLRQLFASGRTTKGLPHARKTEARICENAQAQ